MMFSAGIFAAIFACLAELCLSFKKKSSEETPLPNVPLEIPTNEQSALVFWGQLFGDAHKLESFEAVKRQLQQINVIEGVFNAPLKKLPSSPELKENFVNLSQRIAAVLNNHSQSSTGATQEVQFEKYKKSAVRLFRSIDYLLTNLSLNKFFRSLVGYTPKLTTHLIDKAAKNIWKSDPPLKDESAKIPGEI